VFWGILHRMIFLDLVRVFLLALVALTSILLLGGIFSEATRNGLSPAQVLAVIPLLIPNTFPYTLPTTTLFATCVIYGRLAHDNEILAMKAAGINLTHVVWPALLLGTLASVGTFVLYMDTIPYTHNILRTSFINDVEELLYMTLKRDGCIRHGKMGYVIYVKRVEGRTLVEATFMRRGANGFFDAIAWAREAELHVDLAKRQIIVDMRQSYVSSGDNQDGGPAGDSKWPVDLPEPPAMTKRPSQLRWFELFAKEAETREELETLLLELDAGLLPEEEGTKRSHSGPNDRLRHLRNDIANLKAEMHLRPSLAFGCLCFVMVGCPIGIWFSKSDYLSAFITCFLPIVVMYYPLLLCGINMGKAGSIHPGISIWVANALMGLAALYLFRRLMKN
jgi:lipopolysaccharide export system permease protein